MVHEKSTRLRAGASAVRAFAEGDKVVLAAGVYQGTPGVFLRLRPDVNWADIVEWNGRMRSHPLAWLEHTK
jgi:hypothetical protein